MPLQKIRLHAVDLRVKLFEEVRPRVCLDRSGHCPVLAQLPGGVQDGPEAAGERATQPWFRLELVRVTGAFGDRGSELKSGGRLLRPQAALRAAQHPNRSLHALFASALRCGAVAVSFSASARDRTSRLVAPDGCRAQRASP